MLYRALECGIYDNNVEPTTTVWFSAYSSREAQQKLIDLLAQIWGVEHWQVFTNGAAVDEIDILLNSAQEESAGDRRLLESGWACGQPVYADFSNALVLLGGRDRDRLYRAWGAARQHVATEVIPAIEAYAASLSAAGRERDAENALYSAGEARQFALGIGRGVLDGNALAQAGHTTALQREIGAIGRLVRNARWQRENRKHKAAGDNEAAALARALALAEGVQE
jgi:hypothetical protein